MRLASRAELPLTQILTHAEVCVEQAGLYEAYMFYISPAEAP